MNSTMHGNLRHILRVIKTALPGACIHLNTRCAAGLHSDSNLRSSGGTILLVAPFHRALQACTRVSEICVPPLGRNSQFLHTSITLCTPLGQRIEPTLPYRNQLGACSFLPLLLITSCNILSHNVGPQQFTGLRSAQA